MFISWHRCRGFGGDFIYPKVNSWCSINLGALSSECVSNQKTELLQGMVLARGLVAGNDSYSHKGAL